jgi:hypothetical protein
MYINIFILESCRCARANKQCVRAYDKGDSSYQSNAFTNEFVCKRVANHPLGKLLDVSVIFIISINISGFPYICCIIDIY